MSEVNSKNGLEWPVDTSVDVHSQSSENRSMWKRFLDVMMFFPKNPIVDESGSAQLQSDFLPFDVRYALKHKEAMFDVNEITQILSSDRFQGLGLYLTLKYYQSSPNIQKQLLAEVLPLMKQGQEYSQINDVLLQYLRNYSGLPSINGTKVAQVFRQGPDLIEERFSSIAKTVKDEKSVPFLIANASFLSLRQFAMRMEDGDELFVIYPQSIADKPFGYRIKFESGVFDVKTLEVSDFDTQSDFVVVDDTCGLDAHFSPVINFITQRTKGRVLRVTCAVGTYKSKLDLQK